MRAVDVTAQIRDPIQLTGDSDCVFDAAHNLWHSDRCRCCHIHHGIRLWQAGTPAIVWRFSSGRTHRIDGGNRIGETGKTSHDSGSIVRRSDGRGGSLRADFHAIRWWGQYWVGGNAVDDARLPADSDDYWSLRQPLRKQKVQ